MQHINIDGRAVADRMIEFIRSEVTTLNKAHCHPKLVSIRVGDNPAVDRYIRNQKRNADRAGIEFVEQHYPSEITVEAMTTAIARHNVDPTITGIILQRPVPEHLSIKALQETIHPMKDVEGMHPESIGNIVYGELELGPCTAMASVELLKSTGMKLQGLEVTVIGHSEIVGKPIAFLLMAEGATVTVCHHMTREVAIHSRRADAVFVAVGKAGLLTGEMIKPGAVVIDIGINVVEDENGKRGLVGDCDYESCLKTAGWITPVPGGVGPVTVAILMRNTVIAARRLRQHYSKQVQGNEAHEQFRQDRHIASAVPA